MCVLKYSTNSLLFSLKAVSRVNAQNRQRNTRNHHAGSRPFAVFMDEAAREHPEVNQYVYTYESAYPDS